MTSPAKSLAWSDLHEGQRVVLSFIVTAEDMLAFGRLSGDLNPLHIDEDFARAKGFDGPVVYGGILVMHLSRLIGMELPGRDTVWTRLEIEYRNPLYVGEQARVEAEIIQLSEAVQAAEMKFKIRATNRLLASGQLGVLVRNGA
jgi:acyl dehydratase